MAKNKGSKGNGGAAVTEAPVVAPPMTAAQQLAEMDAAIKAHLEARAGILTAARQDAFRSRGEATVKALTEWVGRVGTEKVGQGDGAPTWEGHLAELATLLNGVAQQWTIPSASIDGAGNGKGGKGGGSAGVTMTVDAPRTSSARGGVGGLTANEARVMSAIAMDGTVWDYGRLRSDKPHVLNGREGYYGPCAYSSLTDDTAKVIAEGLAERVTNTSLRVTDAGRQWAAQHAAALHALGAHVPRARS